MSFLSWLNGDDEKPLPKEQPHSHANDETAPSTGSGKHRSSLSDNRETHIPGHHSKGPKSKRQR